jgi:monolysocardiolipin acyltransferase
LPEPFEFVDPAHAEPASYLGVHAANSGRLFHRLVRRLSLHMQASGGRAVFGAPFGNTLKVYHGEHLIHALQRPANQSLITVSNHQSTIDDPMLLSSLLPYSLHTDPSVARWGWCARELCFATPLLTWLFRHGKIFPITRGLGLHQSGVREAGEHVAAGQWMHVFPEGKCVPLARGIGQLRWGAAKLVADAARRSRRCEAEKAEWIKHQFAATTAAAASALDPSPAADASPVDDNSDPLPAVPPSAVCPLPPLLLPIVHHGMPRILPFYHSVPKRGHTVRALIGRPIVVQDLLDHHARNSSNRRAWDFPREEDLYVALTQRISDAMHQLDQQLVDIEAAEGDPTPEVAPWRNWYDAGPK